MRLRKRLLLVTVLLVLAAAVGIWSWRRVAEARRQARFIAWFVAAGGGVTMDYEAEGRPPPSAPLWLRAILGDWPYSHVVGARADSEFLDTAELEHCPCLRTLACGHNSGPGYLNMALVELHLNACSVSDMMRESALQDLTALPELRILEVSDCLLYFDDLGHFKALSGLRVLRIGGTNIEDDGMKRLRFLTQLEELDAHDTHITNEGLRVVEKMPRLKKLNVAGNELGNLAGAGGSSGLRPLAALKDVEELSLCDTKLDDDGLKQLPSLEKLSMLYLANTQIGDPGLAHLASLPALAALDLSQTHVTDAGLSQLAGIETLRKLYLAETGVTQAGLDRLRAALPQLEIERDRRATPRSEPRPQGMGGGFF